MSEETVLAEFYKTLALRNLDVFTKCISLSHSVLQLPLLINADIQLVIHYCYNNQSNCHQD